MVGKLSAALCLLLLAGSAIANPTNQTSLLQMSEDAAKACMPDITELIDSDESQESVNATPSQYVCPIHCYVTKLGIVNDGGLNKLIVELVRDFEHFATDHYNESGSESTEMEEHYFEPYFHTIRDINMKVKESCAAKNSSARDVMLKENFGDYNWNLFDDDNDNATSILVPSDDKSIFVPSDERSPMLELIQESEQVCTAKYNLSLFDVVAQYVDAEFNKSAVCHTYCVIQHLGYVDENGLSKLWVDDMKEEAKKDDEYDDFEAALGLMEDVAKEMYTSCVVKYDEIADDYFEKYFTQLYEQHKADFADSEENEINHKAEPKA